MNEKKVQVRASELTNLANSDADKLAVELEVMTVAELSGVMAGLTPYSGTTHQGVREATLAKIHERLTDQSIAAMKKLDRSATFLASVAIGLGVVQIVIAIIDLLE